MSRPRLVPNSLPASPADQSARQLDQTLRQLVSVVSEQTAVARAALPQFWSVAELMKRWNCSHDAVIVHLANNCGYQGARGHKPSVSLDDVLRIDRVLLDSYEARKRVLAVRATSPKRGAFLEQAAEALGYPLSNRREVTHAS